MVRAYIPNLYKYPLNNTFPEILYGKTITYNLDKLPETFFLKGFITYENGNFGVNQTNGTHKHFILNSYLIESIEVPEIPDISKINVPMIFMEIDNGAYVSFPYDGSTMTKYKYDHPTDKLIYINYFKHAIYEYPTKITIKYWDKDAIKNEPVKFININNNILISKPINIQNLEFSNIGYIDYGGNVVNGSTTMHCVYKTNAYQCIGIKFNVLNYESYGRSTSFASVIDSDGNVKYRINIGYDANDTYTYIFDNPLKIDDTLYIGDYNCNIERIFSNIELLYAYNNSQINTPVYKSIVRKPFNFNNKSAVFVGDSITYGHTTGTTVTQNNKFPTLFSNIVGLNYTNRSVAGALFSSGFNNDKTIYTQIQEIPNKESLDFLFIAGGINDWQLDVPLETFKTTIETVCDYINSNFPNTNIIWITPINEAGWGNRGTAGEVQEYRNIITRAVLKNDPNMKHSIVQGNEFNFPTASDSTEYITMCFGDKLHPSEYGYRNLYVPGLLTALL